jgi:hypothetical protein
MNALLGLGSLGLMIPICLACVPCFIVSSICCCVEWSSLKSKIEGFEKFQLDQKDFILNDTKTLLIVIAAVILMILVFKYFLRK